MFMDFKYFDEAVQAFEKQREQAMQAWEEWMEFVEDAAKKYQAAYQPKKK